MGRWLQLVVLVMLVVGLRVAAGAQQDRGGPRAEQRRTFYCHYPEQHKITTKDGYILRAFRLKLNTTGREPVLLQHSIATNANSWFKLGDDSLPCVLAREGFDVWVGNSRGTWYSREHTSKYNWRIPFWDFSLHEMAVGDLPATIDYILQKTSKSKLSYVGHGVGAALAFIMLSNLPEYNRKLNVAVSYAPVCYCNPDAGVWFVAYTLYWTTHLIRKFAVALDILAFLGNYVEKREAVMDDSEQWANSRDPSNVDEKFLLEALKTLDYLVNKKRSRALLSRHLDITSIKAFLHYCQLIWSGSFAKRHIDMISNWIYYGQADPPRYRFDLKRITTPQFIIYSDDDAIVKGKGVRYLISYLPRNVGKSEKVQIRYFGHHDFLYSWHAKNYVYDITVRELKRYLPPPPPPPTTTTPVNPECLVYK